jgi:large repetitive protein
MLLLPVGAAFAQDSTATVDMQAISFAPPVIHVTPGTTVLWTNSTSLQHTVTADDGAFDSGPIRARETFSQLFDTPGVYQYFCQPHGAAALQGMSGAIVVDDPNAPEDAQEPVVQAPAPQQRDTNPADYQPDH